jgi:acetyl esterase/lipase
MELDRVAAELQRPLRKVPPTPFNSALGRWAINAAIRLIPAIATEGVEMRRVAGAASGLRVHIPLVRKSRGALLWIHGGGFMIGRPALDDRLCGATALKLGIAVIAASYRLAPKHPFPAPLDDCFDAWRWVQDHASDLGIDPNLVAVGGQSAGGGLAASLIQRIQDSDGPHAAAQWLFSPMLDDRTAARRDLDAAENFVWDNRFNALGWSAYLGTEPGVRDLPDYASAARRSALEGLPPAWIGVGELDLFLEENRADADRLRAAGVDVAIDTIPGAPHGFESWAYDSGIAQGFVKTAQAWLEKTLAQQETAAGVSHE